MSHVGQYLKFISIMEPNLQMTLRVFCEKMNSLKEQVAFLMKKNEKYEEFKKKYEKKMQNLKNQMAMIQEELRNLKKQLISEKK
jgi:uncharacterized protein YeaO (DUF488 family)